MSISIVRIAGPGEDDRIINQSNFKIPLTLPAILGRGSLLKCGERKLSRRHACLDWDDDDLQITSTHQNPTYVVVGGEEKELKNGDSAQLSHGDKFGLMQNGFWFRLNLSSVNAEKDKSPSDTSADKNSSKDVDGEEVAGQSKDTVENGQDETAKSSSKAEESNGINNNVEKDVTGKKEEEDEVEKSIKGEEKEAVEPIEEKLKDVPNGCADVKDSNGSEGASPQEKIAQDIQAAVSPRKRNLPSWLLKASPKKSEEKESAQTTKSTHGGDKKRTTSAKRKQPDAAGDTPSKVKRQAVDDEDTTPTKKAKSPAKPKLSKVHDVSDESSDEGQSNWQKRTNQTTPRKAMKQSPSPRKSPVANKSPLKNADKVLHDMSDASSDDDVEQSSNVAKKENKSPTKKNQALSRQLESDDETQGTSTAKRQKPAAATPSPVKRKKRARKSCQYGSNCYRKNPSHKAQFAHVGDSDYQEEESESEDPDDDRPQCEHGIDCYRTNKKHRKEYRHSRVPQPKRRAKYRAQKKKAAGENDSEDEYDYDDPFLNDESSDDYAPTDSDSDSPIEDAEEEDNTSRMLKEAKKFIRKRR